MCFDLFFRVFLLFQFLLFVSVFAVCPFFLGTCLSYFRFVGLFFPHGPIPGDGLGEKYRNIEFRLTMSYYLHVKME